MTLEIFFQSFIPLFVAIDVFGVLPMFISFTNGISTERRKRLITQAMITALIVSFIFLFAGQAVFRFLGITESDFRIAGGILLLVLAVRDLSSNNPTAGRGGTTPDGDHDTVGVVPIGIPLMIGPAALTSLLLSAEAHGLTVTSFSLFLNLGIVWLVFRKSDFIEKLITRSGAKAIAKVMALFLAAIGIMMIRMGFKDIFFN